MAKNIYPSQTKEARKLYVLNQEKLANPDQTKVCTKCKESKLLREFSKGEGLLGKRSQCKKCQWESNKGWREKNPKKWREITEKHSKSDHARNTHLIRTYGITLAQYNKMLIEQNRVCAICQKPNNLEHRLYVDHHHKSGEVRALLCQKCNLIIGMCDEEPERLLKIVEYMITKKKEIDNAKLNRA